VTPFNTASLQLNDTPLHKNAPDTVNDQGLNRFDHQRNDFTQKTDFNTVTSRITII